MYLLYLDESGVPERHPDQTTHYVALGVSVHESTWYELEQKMAGVRDQFGLPPHTELHAKWMLRRYFEQDEVDGFDDLRWPARRKAVETERTHRLDRSTSESKRRRKEALFRHTDPFVHLSRAERNDLVRAALEVVGSFSEEMQLFGEAINKETLSEGIDPVAECFEQLVTRFELFLQQKDQCGLLVIDHNETQAKKLPHMLREFQTHRTRWSPINRVIEAPFFVDSATCSGIQLADLCGYSLRRCLEFDERERFDLIFHKFYRAGAKLHGLRHFTARGCGCPVCDERGH